MAARRGFQANGDSTPVKRPVERLPLRNLQNELLGQQLVLSTTEVMSSKAALKKKVEVLVEDCSSLHSTSIAMALSLVDTELTKENAAAAVDGEPGFQQKGRPDPLRAEVIDRELELQSRTSCSTVLILSEHTKDVAGPVLTERAGEGADTVYARDQWASAGCLSDGSTSCESQTATADSAVEHCTDNGIGHVTFKSFLCSGVELEIPDTSVITEKTLLLLTQSAADISSGCSFQNSLSDHPSLSQHLDLDSSNGHEDHAYCFPERVDSCSRDELLPVGTTVTALKDPLGGLDPTGQAHMWSSECLEIMQNIWSSSALEHGTAVPNVTADQSQDTAEKSVTADQWQDVAENSLTADKSQDTAEKSFTADRSQDTAEKILGAGQLQDTTEKSITVDQSQITVAPTLAGDQPQYRAVQVLAAECKVCETSTDLQRGSPRLREPGPGGPWDGADSPVGPRNSPLWMGNVESPMPLPQLHSTLIQSILASAIATPQTTKPKSRVLLPPAEGDAGPQPGPQPLPGHLTGTQTGPLQENLGPQAPGHMTGTQTAPLQENLGLQALGHLTGTQTGPLQEKLRQMGELFIRASQDLHPAVERHSASTWTSPVPLAEHAVNTSGVFERKREFSVAEAGTSTDSLPWNLAPEAVAGWSRQDLEQRLFSTLTMAEVLSQQLASARAQRRGGHAPPPSDLRDRLVQTDHTELSQGVVFRELYVKAQERIRALELEQEQQQHLLQELRSSSSTMATLGAETERALSSVNEMGKIASEDQVSISEQMRRMRALYGRFREALRRTEERMQRCAQETLLAEQQEEEALRTKEASLAVLEQLQSRHAAQVATLEQSVGAHLELLPALSNAYQGAVSLNEEYVESLQAADELLKDTLCVQSRIYEELSKAQFLLRRTGPVLLKLHQKAAAALQARDLQQRDANRIRDELEQTTSCLQHAQQEVGDLNLQVTILTSEMAVLRQRLSELEEDRAQAEMRSTELSATLSSTQASYTFLQQQLGAQTHRLEEVQKEAFRCEEKLAKQDVQLAEMQRCLHEFHAQLSSACENNEFLQMESEMAREDAVQSGALAKSHLQALRDRNLECEDLKQELNALRLQRETLQEELFSTQENLRSSLLHMEKQLALASTDIILVHHKVYTLTSALNTTLNTQKPGSSCKERPPSSLTAPPRHSARSFVDSVMVAATTEEKQTAETDECPSAALGSGNSAFTRVATTTPKKCEEGNDVRELLGGLGDAVSQLVCTVDRVRELRDRQCEELKHTVSRLQGELDSQASVYGLQVADLRGEVANLQAQGEKYAVALQLKAQEERTIRKLCSDLDESREIHQQQKSENKELRRELSALRSSLQRTQVEAQFLKEELSGGQSAGCLTALEEKVCLQKEVDKLRKSLSEAEDSRSKLLERAKRNQVVLEANQRSLESELHILHQTLKTVKSTLSSIPEVVKDCEQLEKLVNYLG